MTQSPTTPLSPPNMHVPVALDLAANHLIADHGRILRENADLRRRLADAARVALKMRSLLFRLRAGGHITHGAEIGPQIDHAITDYRGQAPSLRAALSPPIVKRGSK